MTKITALAAEAAFNAGEQVFKGTAKSAPFLQIGRTGQTWHEACEIYGGHTRRAWYVR